MARTPRPEKQAAPEPEYAWGETPAGAPEIRWEHSARGVWAHSIPEADGVLLMEKERTLLRRASTGDVQWERPAEDLPDEVAADADTLCLAREQVLEAVDTRSGAARWSQRLGGKINTVALAPERVYAAITQRQPGPVFALGRADGKSLWRAPLKGEPEVYPYSDRGLTVVADPEAALIYGYAAADGARQWEFSAEGQAVVAGPVAGDVLLISAHEAGAMGVDVATGEVRWTLTGGTFEEPAVAAGETGYFTDGTVYAVHAGTGDVLWKREPSREEKVFALRLQGDLLFAETWQGRLLALDPDTGALRWERRLGQVQGLAGDDHRLYLRLHRTEPESQWSVVALDRATGTPAWELRARRMIPDITLVGRVLVVEFRSAIVGLAV